jgi:hypothetical protein
MPVGRKLWALILVRRPAALAESTQSTLARHCHRGIYAEFVDENELRTKVSRNLAAIMVRLSTGRSATPAPRPPDLARVYIRSRPGERSGDVRTVQVSAMIENISPVRRISSYMVELSVPKACLTHTSAIHMREVRKDQSSDRRYFRRSEHEPGAIQYIFKGDKVPIFALDLGVNQLKIDMPSSRRLRRHNGR